MDGKKKIWATAVLCAVASVGFVVPAGAEETMVLLPYVPIVNSSCQLIYKEGDCLFF